MINYKLIILIQVLLIFVSFSACSQSKPAEKNLYSILENKKEVFYFQDEQEYGDYTGKKFTLAEILKVNSPSCGINQQAIDQQKVNENKDNEIVHPPFSANNNLPDGHLKETPPLRQAGSGRINMHIGDGRGDYFIIDMNYETSLPQNIYFQGGLGNDLMISYSYNDSTGEPTGYGYNESQRVSNDWMGDHVSHKEIYRKLYIFDDRDKAREVNPNVEDKAKVLAAAHQLRTLVCNLWHLYANAPTIDFKLTINESGIRKSIDSLLAIYQTSYINNGDKNKIWTTFKDNKVQLLYELNKRGSELDRRLIMYGLRSPKGEFDDRKFRKEIEEILLKNISSNEPQNRGFRKNASKGVSLIIEKGKLTEIKN